MGRRKRESAVEISTNPSAGVINMEPQVNETSEYELSREQRIKENLERMQKLGIVDLSLRLKADSISKKVAKRNSPFGKRSPLGSPLPSSGPIRRSSRLKNVTPVSYSEVHPMNKDNGSLGNDDGVFLERGAKPEIYTVEHEKLVGATERNWTLFVDGYDSNRRRIYDPVRGKTCHQCRQKTLGLRTHCSKCQMVQGQFCGDCLYMRYGEHVLEANENPDWVCPVCRGICNCSLCRQAKGWPPTGPLYRRILKLGFKSVAHYLIENNLASPSSLETKKGKADATPHSAKRSLVFHEMKEEVGECEEGEGSPKPVDSQLGVPLEYNDKPITEPNSKNEKEIALSNEPKTDGVDGSTRKRCREENTNGNEVSVQNENAELGEPDHKNGEDITAFAFALASPDAGQDSIARRLRPRSCKPRQFIC
ncbi:hypothetical protein Dimus_014333 [Dionaea muscipula]